MDYAHLVETGVARELLDGIYEVCQQGRTPVTQ